MLVIVEFHHGLLCQKKSDRQKDRRFDSLGHAGPIKHWTTKHWIAARIWRRERRAYGTDNGLPGFAAFAAAPALAGGNDTAIRLAERVGSSGNSSFRFLKVFL
jgi:hypothetical protein